MRFAFLSSFAHLALEERPGNVSGGAELQIALLARALVARGHEVTVIGTDEGQQDRRMLHGVSTRVGGRFHAGDLSGTITSFLRVAAVLRECRPEVVGIMGAGTWVFFLWLMRRALGFRLAFIAGSDIDANGDYRRANPIKGALYEFALRRCDARLAMTEDQADAFRGRGLACGLYRNLLPGQGAEREAAPASKEIDFLWVSSAQALKRPDLFIDLAEAFPSHRFTMICPLKQDRPLWESTRERAAGVSNLTFVDWVPYAEIQPYFDRAKVFVNTSDYEGYPNTFVQSGLGGAALLSLRVDPDGVMGRHGAGVCAGGDLQVFHRAAARFMHEPDFLHACQARCAALIRAWHDNDGNVDAFLESAPTVWRRSR
jgi:hypothetical protein